MQKVFYLATSNPHKIKEISNFLPSQVKSRFLIQSLGDFPDYLSPKETGSCFHENADIKSSSLLDYLRNQNRLESLFGILAEDSGLEVSALNGAPGVFSARYGGPEADDKKNNQLLLDNMKKQTDRKACYVCVLSFLFFHPDQNLVKTHWTGSCKGRLAIEERGQGGFGYDSIFIPEGEQKTFGELGFEFKQSLSHRRKALEKWKAYFLLNFN